MEKQLKISAFGAFTALIAYCVGKLYVEQGSSDLGLLFGLGIVALLIYGQLIYIKKGKV